MEQNEILKHSGEALYGSRWKTDLAVALGPYHPDGPRDQVDDRLMRRWAAGQRSIPAWVWPALVGLLRQRQDRGAAVIREITRELRAQGA